MREQPLVQNAGDETQVKAAKRREHNAAHQALEDLRFILNQPQGRRMLWRYLDSLDRISAHNSGSWTYFNDGERNLALKIKADIIKADPKLWVKMQLEQIEKGDL